jgi:carboxylesterase
VPDIPVLPGAEPFAHTGDRRGVLVLHGFTGTPATVRPLADAFVDAGWTVSAPRLPGHGTSVDDMEATGWADWSSTADDAYRQLAARVDSVVVAGLSMGGGLAAELATRHDVSAVVCVNPKVLAADADTVTDIRGLVEDGMTRLGGIGSDIAAEGVVEVAYDVTPLIPLLSMWEGLVGLVERVRSCTAPLLLMTSPQDHVVPPEESDALAAAWGGPVERVTLERSYHVATLDHDAELIRSSAVEFATKVVAAGGGPAPA